MANLLSTTVNGSLLALNNGVTNAYTTASNGRLYLGSSAQNDYSIYTHMESFGGNYTKLTLDWHTGIKIGASQAYGGIRFYSDSVNNGGVKLFSVGEGDGNVRVSNTLHIGDTSTGLYLEGSRLRVRSTSVDNVAQFATYGMYLPQTGQTAGLYVESPIEARGGLRIGDGASSGTITVGADTSVVANRIVQRDANGYIYANHVNFSTPESENPTISSFITSNGDGWSRKSSLAHVRNQLGNYGSWITTDGRAYPRRADGTNINFYWDGQGGQPTWLWGSNNGVDFYVWNPSNFSVNFANSSTSAAYLNYTGVGATQINANTFGYGRASNYYGTSQIINSPEGAYASLYNFGGTNESALSLQMFASVNHNDTASTRNLWFRVGNNLGFQNDWKQVIHSGNIASQSVSYAVTSGTSSATTQTNFSDLSIGGEGVATREYVTSQGYLTSLPSHNHDDRYYTESESDGKYLIGTTNPGSVANFTISIGNNGSYSYVQSHSGQPLYLNPVGNSIVLNSTTTIAGTTQFNGNVSWFSGTSNIGLENQTTFARFAFNKLTFWDWNNGYDVMTIDDGYVSSATSFRAPIFYDSNDTNYYLDPSSNTSIRTVGSWRADSSTWDGEYAGKIQYHGNWWYFQSLNGWVFRRENGVEPFTFIQSGNLNITGDSNTPINITGSAHKYLTINPGNGWEAMVRYIGGSGSSWYVGKRTSGQLVGTESFHFYSEAAGATVGGINPSGDMHASGSMRAPIFYDSNNTDYYLDPNSTGTALKINGGIVSTAGNGAVLLRHENSEANAWIFRENAANWGLFWFNAGGQSGQTIGSYTTAGAELFGMNNAVTGFNPNSAWSGTDASTRAAWMLSNYSGYLWTQGTQYSETDMRAPIFYDSANTAYFLDPNADFAMRVYGEICNSNNAEGKMQPGALNIGRTDTNYAWDGTSWASDVRLGLLAHTSETWEFGIHDSGDSVMSVVHFDGGSTLTMGRNLGWGQCVVNAPAGYVSNGNPWGTSNSAFFPNGITTAGGTNWIYGFTYIGNAPSNGAGHEFTTSGTQYSTGSITTPLFLVNNHSDNTRGYRIHNTSGSSVSAMFTNSGNALVIGAGAFDQVQLNKKTLINGAALGVNVAASATAGRIDASNDIVAYSSSDERLKHNIAPIENALDKVKSLTGVEFDWKPEYKQAHGYEGHDTGIIAQQVQDVMPSAVRTNDTGFLAVRYEKLIGLLIEGMKEQQAQIDELKAKLDGLTK